MQRLKNWFEEQGLDPKQDIPKAVIIHEVLGAGMRRLPVQVDTDSYRLAPTASAMSVFFAQAWL